MRDNEAVSMKKLALLGAMLSLASLCWAGSERRDAIDRLNNAAKVLDEIMSAPDQRIPDEIMKRAKCIAVIPHLIKGGFVFGAEHGKGMATCRTAEGWSAPAFIRIAGGSWGTQLGAEAVDLVNGHQERKGYAEATIEQIRNRKGCIGSTGTRGTAFFGKYGFEAGCLDPDLLSPQRCFRWIYIQGRIGPPRQQFQARHVRAQGHHSGYAARSSGGACRSRTVS